ncbi:MAG: DUF177 domain-containing protein [Thalassovita sp.]
MNSLPHQPLRVADLSTTKPTRFSVIPEAPELSAMAQELDLNGLRKVRFKGEVKADGKRDWVLSAKLGATVTQACVVTLAPVTTRIETEVFRRFVAEMPEFVSDDEEVEMPENDSDEQLGSTIDPAQVMIEALSLALPLYPRADGAEVEETVFTEPGKDAMTDEDTKPFAGLASLRDQLSKKDEEEPK